MERQLDQELDAKRVNLRTERNLPIALGNYKTRDLNGFIGATVVFLIVLKPSEVSFNPTDATKSVKEQKHSLVI